MTLVGKAKYILFSALFFSISISRANICFKAESISQTVLQESPIFSFSFRFTNNSESPVKILKITTNCNCTKARADREIYLPNESGEISGEFEIGSRTGMQSKKIFVETDDPQNPKIVLSLNLDIPLLAEFRPKMLLWQMGSELSPKKVRIDTAREYAARIVDVASKNPNFKIEFAPQNQDTDFCEFTVIPTDLSEKTTAEVEIFCEGKNGIKKTYKLFLLVR